MDKPISRVLLEFARPLIKVLGERPSREELEIAVRIASAVWNAVVQEEAGAPGEPLERVRREVEGYAMPAAVLVFDALVNHKRQAFASDRRLILRAQVIEGEGGRLGVEVEAGAPEA